MDIKKIPIRQTHYLRFEFRKSKFRKSHLSGTPDARPDRDGTLYVTLYLNNIPGVPFSTRINTFRSIWDGRKAPRVSKESQDLTKEIEAFRSLIEEIHTELVRAGKLVTHGLILKNVFWFNGKSRRGRGKVDNSDLLRAIPTQIIALPSVYAEYMKIQCKKIQSDRTIRKPNQISDGTYGTYKTRWTLLSKYLKETGQPDLSITEVGVPFATNFSEWMLDQRKSTGRPYDPSTTSAIISMLKGIMKYAFAKGYLGDHNPLAGFTIRGGSVPNPKPITAAQMDILENMPMDADLRLVCDSWQVAAELCMHYSDYMKLRTAKLIILGEDTFIEQARSKQKGTRLKQTVYVTPRAQRILARRGGIIGLAYRQYNYFARNLEKISILSGLIDEEGKPVRIRFGDGRDTGLTQWAIDGANNTQLSAMGGWSRPTYSEHYIKNALAIVSTLVLKNKQRLKEPMEHTIVPPINEGSPFTQIYRAS